MADARIRRIAELLGFPGVALVAISFTACAPSPRDESPPLWNVYENALKDAKYVDLTHAITPSIPVWAGFGPPTFAPTVDPETEVPYSWEKDGFEATRYVLRTDQLGT